jgi:hypothetical protein
VAFQDHLAKTDGLHFNTVEKKLRFLNAILQLAVDNRRCLPTPVRACGSPSRSGGRRRACRTSRTT